MEPFLYIMLYIQSKSQTWLSQQTCLLHFLQAGGYLLRACRLLREHPEDEVAVFVWLKGGGDDYVLPFRQLQTWADLPQVDEGFWSSAGGMREEKVSLQVDPWTPLELRGALTEVALCFYSILCNIYIYVHMWKVEKPHTSSGTCKDSRDGTWL